MALSDIGAGADPTAHEGAESSGTFVPPGQRRLQLIPGNNQGEAGAIGDALPAPFLSVIRAAEHPPIRWRLPVAIAATVAVGVVSIGVGVRTRVGGLFGDIKPHVLNLPGEDSGGNIGHDTEKTLQRFASLSKADFQRMSAEETRGWVEALVGSGLSLAMFFDEGEYFRSPLSASAIAASYDGHVGQPLLGDRGQRERLLRITATGLSADQYAKAAELDSYQGLDIGLAIPHPNESMARLSDGSTIGAVMTWPGTLGDLKGLSLAEIEAKLVQRYFWAFEIPDSPALRAQYPSATPPFFYVLQITHPQYEHLKGQARSR